MTETVYEKIVALPHDKKERLKQLFEAKTNAQYLPFGMDAGRRGSSIDDDISKITGFYIEGWHMTEVKNALSGIPK